MKRVIIMSGVSGSGKSTYIEKHFPLATCCSADTYFLHFDTKEYRFNASKLGEAHAACFRRFIEAVRGEDEWLASDLVVVDNTNTTIEEIAPYMIGAAAYGYQAEIITFARPTFLAVCEALAMRNGHGVSADTIAAQARRLRDRKLPSYWKNTTVPIQF
jgi:predicted kinase